MGKIIILKNDRVGDLFHSLKGMNEIINEHQKDEIEIYLSEYSSGFSFLFKRENINIKTINYKASFAEKINLYFTILRSPVQKVFILTPKNFFFILPLFFRRIRFYGICIKEKTKERPNVFLRNFLHKYKVNDRSNKNLNEGVGQLIFELCKNKNRKSENFINIEPKNKSIIKNLLDFRYCHFHFKKSLFAKKKWSYDQLNILLERIANKKGKLILTSDIENTEYNSIFKKNYNSYNFTNLSNNSEINFDNSITYFENIKSVDLFYLIKKSAIVISPHGAMSVAASFLNKPVIDIFDNTINKVAFREYRSKNKNYNFLILKPFSEKLINKFNNFLDNA